MFRPCQKVTLTRAPLLTEDDFRERGGVVHTMHGPARFEVGDYLGQDAKDAYPITCETLMQNYQQVSEPDADGFASYQPLDRREAVQMHEAFEVNGEWGKPGDYLLRKGTRMWPVDREIFESSYTFLDE